MKNVTQVGLVGTKRTRKTNSSYIFVQKPEEENKKKQFEMNTTKT